MGHAWLIVPILVTATCWLYILTYLAPSVDEEEKSRLAFPSCFDDLQDLAKLLQIYYERNWWYVLILFSTAYLYKQAFSIPGSALLNILGGALFGLFVGFPLCCFLTAIGASCCFLLSRHFGKELLEKYFPQKVEKNSHQLIYFLLFLRLFPMTPNWLINLASPIMGVPLHLFFVTVLIGLMPYNFLCVQAGEMLTTLTSLDDVFSLRTFGQLALMAAVALGPSILLKKPVEA
ncbi:transmembrane protein 41A-A isoform X2 [Anabrus simplex]|uniref:transmembrane protein 41A-A isoform X2 n=1 Tax=Anabrus simplex TaxID=316456 RepID=UPI0034DCD82E